MFKYFQSNKLKVKFNDTILEDAEVVSCLSTAVGILIPTEYLDTNIMGMMYDATNQAFYECEVIEELTENPEVKAAIDAYTLELIKRGVI